MSFNCGKMKHIFKTDKDLAGKDADDACSYLPEWSCPEAKEAMDALFLSGDGGAKIYRKIDGSCGALIRGADGKYEIYQRYDDKKNKFKDSTEVPEGYIPIPRGENDVKYHFEGAFTYHHYYLKKLDRRPKGKGEQKIAESIYKCLDEATDLVLPFYSVELVGPNFNRTANVPANAIALHSAQEVEHKFGDHPLTPVEWFSELTVYFADTDRESLRDEGLIVEHKGRYWKIHGYKFHPNLAKNYRPPKLL